MKIIICKNSDEASKYASNLFIDVVKQKPNAILGFATGSTPYKFYDLLIENYLNGNISYSNVISFNLDEYVNATGKENYSYRYYMNTRLFNKIDIDINNTYLPLGIGNLPKNCENYDNLINKFGGIDILLLGLGRNGHIGFNEPGTSFNSPTNITKLANRTRIDHANTFFQGDISKVPSEAITMGIKSIMGAQKLVLLAFGESKQNAIKKLVEGPVSTDCPASILQEHNDAIVIVDEIAAKLLIKNKINFKI